MIFGLGEIIYEKKAEGKVSAITLGSNAFILVLGAISLFLQEGIWFKLQPAILEVLTTALLWASLFKEKSLIELMLEKQKQIVPLEFRPFFRGICFRLGLFFLLHAALATWAALYWTTAQWAMLKGIGLTLTLFLYMGVEILWLRKQIRNEK
jgi:intracellular septation protein